MTVASDQDAAVQPAHRMGDDMDRTFRIPLLDCVREQRCPLFAGREWWHHGKQRRMLAMEMGLEAAEVIVSDKTLRGQKAARKYEIHDRYSSMQYGRAP